MGIHIRRQVAAQGRTQVLAARVLIVGEDTGVTMALRAMLRSAGHAAIVATTASEAFVLCATQSFQLAIIDERLSGVSNLQLASALRDAHAIPAVLVATENDPKLVVAALDTGSLGIIVKPLEPTRVLTALEHVLSRVQELHELHSHTGSPIESPLSAETASIPADSLLKRVRRWRKQVFAITSELLGSGDVSDDFDAAISRSRNFRHSLRAGKPDNSPDANS